MNKRLILVGGCVLFFGQSASAQGGAPVNGQGPTLAGSSTTSAGREVLLRGRYSETHGYNPFESADQISEVGSAAFSLELKEPLAPNLDLRLEGGVTADTDFDDDSERDGGTVVFARAALNWNNGDGRANPLFEYRLEHGFDSRLPEFLTVDEYESHRLRLGFTYKGSGPRWRLRGERLFADIDTRRRTSLAGQALWSGKFNNPVKWEVALEPEYRRFDQITETEDRRVDYRLTATGTLELAGLFTSYLPSLQSVRLSGDVIGSASNRDRGRFLGFSPSLEVVFRLNR